VNLTYVFLAGIDNSEPAHWQSLWRGRVARAVWVEHARWDEPSCDAWLEDLERAWDTIAGPKVVIAHSLGCLLFAEWCTKHRVNDVRSLLVAVPDVAGPAFPRSARGFHSAFELGVSRPCRMVASQNDPYASLAYARQLAAFWGADLVDVGAKGHINLGSCLGSWEEGWQLVRGLCAES
jgi:predicted alpha/beta hydrolase family esterase